MILTGKTVLFLGSSVTYGSAAGGISFADVMAEETGCIAIKEAVSGTTLADLDDTSYVSRLKKVDPATKVDLFICQLSTNDASRNIELHKVREAIRFILNYVKDTFGCPVVFYTGSYFESAAYAGMIRLLYALQSEYDFHILDLYHDAGMLAVTPELYKTYMSDPIHPTLAGYRQWWAPKFIEYCQALNPVETAYFAGGCFWCITPTFKETKGVLNVICGYSGGEEKDPTYLDVKYQRTGHREAIRIDYFAEKVSFSELFQIFLDGVDPFDPDGQFIDRGHSYTLAVYYVSQEQKRIAEQGIRRLEQESGKPVYISVEPFRSFYSAEEEHQDYYLKHPKEFEQELIDSGRKKPQ